MNESNGACECTVDRALAYCTIDAQSLVFYVIKASDCTNLGFYTCYVFHIFCILGQFCNKFVSKYFLGKYYDFVKYHFVTKIL